MDRRNIFKRKIHAVVTRSFFSFLLVTIISSSLSKNENVVSDRHHGNNHHDAQQQQEVVVALETPHPPLSVPSLQSLLLHSIGSCRSRVVICCDHIHIHLITPTTCRHVVQQQRRRRILQGRGGAPILPAARRSVSDPNDQRRLGSEEDGNHEGLLEGDLAAHRQTRIVHW